MRSSQFSVSSVNNNMSKRKPNWSVAEIEALVGAVTENIRVVKGKFTPSLTNEVKNRQWMAITERVNAANVSKCDRDVAEVKKKWQDLSNQTKKKEAMRIRHRKATGGSPAIEDDLKSWKTLIIGTFSKSAVEGVPGGVIYILY
ncbi:t-SNARE domain-containing protein 1-like [Ostrea edulis]|uniref:t-SNARE domain-containing protein 1-like n=1 Tax=Ostrea edulis TaxID=37623 RepID=UPI0024AFFCDD|nr:t-SNARE domain-containing protein 1-like [Ostrea edulis]